MPRKLIRIVLVYHVVKLLWYLHGWTRVPLREPQRHQWAYFMLNIVPGYPAGEISHWDRSE